jgi:hypothetical protein
VLQALDVDTSGPSWTAKRIDPNTKTATANGEDSTSLVLSGLKKDTYYHAKITAINRIGPSKETTFVFKTGRGGRTPSFSWLSV